MAHLRAAKIKLNFGQIHGLYSRVSRKKSSFIHLVLVVKDIHLLNKYN